MLRIDHLAVVAERLEDGVAAVEHLFGVPLAGGGKHPLMGTHNRLLSLGDLYLEVIAIDPEAPHPGHPRWFDMDRFAGPPRLANWVAGCDDLSAEVALGPQGVGQPIALARGDYRWQMAVPDDGRLPFDGAFPALIQWERLAHPAPALPDHGLRLAELEIGHPQAAELQRALTGRLTDARVVIVTAPKVTLRATIDTPNGPRVLC
jgi:hypothetical protein